MPANFLQIRLGFAHSRWLPLPDLLPHWDGFFRHLSFRESVGFDVFLLVIASYPVAPFASMRCSFSVRPRYSPTVLSCRTVCTTANEYMPWPSFNCLVAQDTPSECALCLPHSDHIIVRNWYYMPYFNHPHDSHLIRTRQLAFRTLSHARGQAFCLPRCLWLPCCCLFNLKICHTLRLSIFHIVPRCCIELECNAKTHLELIKGYSKSKCKGVALGSERTGNSHWDLPI